MIIQYLNLYILIWIADYLHRIPYRRRHLHHVIITRNQSAMRKILNRLVYSVLGRIITYKPFHVSHQIQWHHQLPNIINRTRKILSPE